MTIDLGTAVVNFTANTAGLEGGFSKVTNMLGGLPLVGIAATAAVVGIGVASLKMAGDFEASMTQLVTGAGESRSAIKMVSDSILAMAPQVGTSTKDLADAMFLIDSAGYKAANGGLTLLRIAAEGAKVGNVNLSQITDVLTTSLHDYHLTVSQAVPVTNSLIQTVKDGKMYMDQLNQSLTNVLPVSNALQVKLSDVEGALATMAASGDKGAAAGTHLSMMLKMLANPASSATKEMTAMGINSITLAEEMRTSLPGALEMIQDAVAKHFTPGSVEFNRAISAILGGSKSGMAGLELMGGSLKTFASNANDIAGTMKNAGSSVQGWADVQQTFNFKMSQAKEVLETLGIKIGTVLMPYVENLMGVIVPLISRFGDWLIAGGNLQRMITFLIDAFKTVVAIVQGSISVFSAIVGFFQKNQWAVDLLVAAMAGLIAAVIAMNAAAIVAAITAIPGLVVAFGAWAIGAAAAALATLAAAAPFIIIGAIVAAVVFGVIMAIQHWGQIMSWLGGVCGAIGSFVGGVFSGLGSFLRGVVSDIGDAFSGLGTLISNIWNGIVGVIKGAINFIIGLIDNFIGGIDSIGVDIGPVHIHPNIPKIPYLASGGSVGPGQAFIAGERGAELITAGSSGASVTPLSGAAGIGGTHTTQIFFDGMMIAQLVAPHMDAMVRAKFGPRSRS